MRVAIFGGTGRVGGEVVSRALARGHEVAALARDPGRLASVGELAVIRGDATDPEAVAAALAGAEAVLSVMGSRTLDATTDLSDATSGVIGGMVNHGPDRLVLLSHVGVFLNKVDPQYQHVVEEHRRNLAAAGSSGLRWTAVCPPGITAAPPNGRVEAVVGNRAPEWSIPRGDLADFLLDQLETEDHVGVAVGVSAPSR